MAKTKSPSNASSKPQPKAKATKQAVNPGVTSTDSPSAAPATSNVAANQTSGTPVSATPAVAAPPAKPETKPVSAETKESNVSEMQQPKQAPAPSQGKPPSQPQAQKSNEIMFPKKGDPKPLQSAAEDLDGAIRQRAYEIFQERHGAPGNPREDWARAEREVRERLSNLEVKRAAQA